RRRHTRSYGDWSSDVCSSDLAGSQRSATGTPAIEPPRRKSKRGTLYRGREGMWSWVAHRITGVLIFFFLFAHVLDTALVRVSQRSEERRVGKEGRSRGCAAG